MRGRPLTLAALGILWTSLALSTGAQAQAPTPGAEAYERLFLLVLILAVVIGGLVMVLLVIIAIKFRRRKGNLIPPENPRIHHPKLEATWTIVPAVILLVLALATYQALLITDAIPENPDVVVRAIGQQWFWEFCVTVGSGPETCSVGEFTVRVGQTVTLITESKDVNHALSIPDFRFKLDAIPGRQNHGWFQSNVAGDFIIYCAEFCGLQHSGMRAVVHVVA